MHGIDEAGPVPRRYGLMVRHAAVRGALERETRQRHAIGVSESEALELVVACGHDTCRAVPAGRPPAGDRAPERWGKLGGPRGGLGVGWGSAGGRGGEIPDAPGGPPPSGSEM